MIHHIVSTLVQLNFDFLFITPVIQQQVSGFKPPPSTDTGLYPFDFPPAVWRNH